MAAGAKIKKTVWKLHSFIFLLWEGNETRRIYYLLPMIEKKKKCVIAMYRIPRGENHNYVTAVRSK